LIPGPLGYDRFGVPFIPYIAVLNGLGLIWLIGKLRQLRDRRRVL
jgi:hypothetical protein